MNQNCSHSIPYRQKCRVITLLIHINNDLIRKNEKFQTYTNNQLHNYFTWIKALRMNITDEYSNNYLPKNDHSIEAHYF